MEDFYARLGRIEAKMERQTELMQNILDSLNAVSDIESDTQSILEKENKESHTLQDIGTSIQEYTDFTKTLEYCAVTGVTVWQVLCKTWKHIDKSMSPVSTVPTAHVSTTPATTPTRPSLFKNQMYLTFRCLSVYFFSYRPFLALAMFKKFCTAHFCH